MKYPVYIPEITSKEKEYVNDCLDTTWISSKGKYVDLFEQKIEKYTGVNHAVAVFNGTVALHLALEVVGIKEGDDVIVPDFTYIASANAVSYCKANVILADVCPDSWNIRLTDIEKVITPNTKAIIITDIYGNPVEMDEIKAYCKSKNIVLIADSAESLGASYKDLKTGNIADISTFSFFGNKTITTGEGGMVTTNNPEWDKQLRKLKNQGNHEEIRYFHDVLGYNYRMTNIQAAIGCAQMERVDEILANKYQVVNWYKEFLADYVTFQKVEVHAKSSYWMVSFLLPLNVNRLELMDKLLTAGIESRPFFSPIHIMPHHKNEQSKQENTNTINISKSGLSVPSYPSLKKEDVSYICKTIIDHIK